jgi:hypothetical protein
MVSYGFIWFQIVGAIPLITGVSELGFVGLMD